MRKGYVFGSSTPRQLSHQKVREKSSVLEALSNDPTNDVHDVRTFVKNIHNNPSPRSKSLPKSSKSFVFGSSTPREWSHMVKVPAAHRAYDAKLPRKERSQTVSSLRSIHGGSVKSLQFENKVQIKQHQPATSREARPKNQRVNLPPAPSTSRSHRIVNKNESGEEDEDIDAASEPDIKMDRARKEFSARENKPVKQVAMKMPTNKEPKMVASNHVTETDSEIIFERSEELFAPGSYNTGKQVTALNAAEDGVMGMPVIRRASDREMLSVEEDLQLSNPVQVDIAQVVAVNPRNEGGESSSTQPITKANHT